jgi:hypothetical protein
MHAMLPVLKRFVEMFIGVAIFTKICRVIQQFAF